MFNLKQDPGELNNLASQHPEVAQDLKNTLDAWYNQVIVGEHLVNPPRIAIGSHYENPVILNRNDAKGAPGVWTQDHVYAYWDVRVLEDGLYNIKVNFLNELPAPGRYVLKVGTIQRTIISEKPGQKSLTLER
ncbi:MAG: hypothetical protein HC880_01715 [Bacteroidia bacterium]|nr:hypothetical protein [Bacteroidia bacterium]